MVPYLNAFPLKIIFPSILYLKPACHCPFRGFPVVSVIAMLDRLRNFILNVNDLPEETSFYKTVQD